jgi:hypothetical protein
MPHAMGSLKWLEVEGQTGVCSNVAGGPPRGISFDRIIEVRTLFFLSFFFFFPLLPKVPTIYVMGCMGTSPNKLPHFTCG